MNPFTLPLFSVAGWIRLATREAQFTGIVPEHQAAENLAAMRRLAVNLLRRDKQCERSIQGKLMRAAIDPDYLRHLLTI